MSEMTALQLNVDKWRNSGIESYWLSLSYIGSEFNRIGDHTITVVDGILYHQSYDESWRKINIGSDFWLFSVIGTFVWARDFLEKVLPEKGGDEDVFELDFGDEGYIKHMRVHMASRDVNNLDLDVRSFGRGAHPSFTPE